MKTMLEIGMTVCDDAPELLRALHTVRRSFLLSGIGTLPWQFRYTMLPGKSVEEDLPSQ